MVRAVEHESFYATGVVSDDRAGVHVGWAGHGDRFPNGLPLVSQSGEITAVVVGQLFGEACDLASQTRDSAWVALADALDADDRRAEHQLRSLNGWFAGVLIDANRGTCALFNDRYGMHRLFYSQSAHGAYFASEAKALLAVLPETRAFDPTGLAEFASCGCTLGEQSLFRGVRVLPGASLLRFVGTASPRRRQYFDRAEWEARSALRVPEFTSRFVEAFVRIVPTYVPKDVSAAVSLTGGLDSRMVLAAAAAAPGTLPCYTFGSEHRDTLDVVVSRQIAARCGQPHYVVTLGSDFRGALPGLIEKSVSLSDGYLGLSGAAEVFANAAVRRIASVRLTGNYGGESLRGVRAFDCDTSLGRLFAPELRGQFTSAALTFHQQAAGMPGPSFAVFHQAPHQGYGRLAIESSQVVPRTPFFDNELIELCYQSPRDFDGLALAVAVLSVCQPALLDVPTDRGVLGTGGPVRRSVRRAVREGLFKAEYLASHGMPDFLVRRAALRRWLGLEKRLLGRHKFYHLRSLLRDDLEAYVRDTLSSRGPALGSYFDQKAVATVLDEHYSDRRNHTGAIDTMLTIAVTHRNLLAPISPWGGGTPRKH